ncbi:MAG: S9 family peptidase [Bryobacterales bacterium]|nr:S9 family peptidase [Bryobacterales bacterium]
MPKVTPFFSLATIFAACLAAAPFTASDLSRLRSVGAAVFSPDGRFIAYTVENNDTPGKPYSQIWLHTIATNTSAPLSAGKDSSSEPVWSPDSTRLAYSGRHNGKSALMVTPVPAFAPKFLAELDGTNNPLPSMGNRFTWSPDGRRIAFVSAVPGPETAEATGDPVVITRYLYKPDADEGNTRFNDNKRLHIFLVDAAGGAVRALTTGNHYEHSIDWSPDGSEIAFVSNREPNEDQFFNYDLFALRVADGTMRRLTATENIEYRPRWSPDGKSIVYQGCKRGLTDLETTMEDTHTWVINADGSGRRELAALDNRQGEPVWAPEGNAVYFTVRERGSTALYRAALSGGAAEAVIRKAGAVGAFSVGRGGQLAYAFSSPNDTAQLFLDGRQLTNLNAALMKEREVAPVESFRYISNDNKWEVEAFLTRPLGMTANSKHPLIVVIHGGPHGMQGPAFNFRNQVYASRGWATLMVNYRGSIGYGQAFADGVFGDQNGNEAQDVLYGVSAAMRRNLWIDRDRIGVEGVSYGGQLSAWLITQTRLFKSSIPTAAIINLVSYNYTTYYNQYEQMTFGVFPHQGNLMDTLWERSALKHVAKAATPTLLVHGENDNDVPVSEAEQFYIALKDVGVETVFVRYPREGHGLKEVKHIIDWTERSMRWHESHFPK